MALIKHDLIRHWALQQIRIEYQLGSKQSLDNIPSFKLMMNIQCLQSSRSHVGGSNLDFCVEEKFQYFSIGHYEAVAVGN